jgi:hypothetical protein
VIEIDSDSGHKAASSSDTSGTQLASLINMNQVFLLTDKAIKKDSASAASSFFTQAHTPNFRTDWRQIITEEALVLIRFRLCKFTESLGYTDDDCDTWPVVDGQTLTLRKIAMDLRNIYADSKRSESTFDLDAKVKAYRFRMSWSDQNIEDQSFSEFHELITNFYTDLTDMTPTHEHELCKAFYKKLPEGNKFTENFNNATKTETANKKKDTIKAMYKRLGRCLRDGRRTVEDADKMGGKNYTFITPLSPSASVTAGKSTGPPSTNAAPYKPIAKRQPDEPFYPGLDRTIDFCHTCGRTGHNRYACRNHMNPHCNNTNLTWNKSPVYRDFQQVGHNHFVPYITLANGEYTKQSKNASVPYDFEFPTEEEDVDFGPPPRAAQQAGNQRQAAVHHHDRTQHNRPQGGNKNQDRKSKHPKNVKVEPILPRIDLPRTYALLSAILPDKVKDYLQVHISLPQIITPPADETLSLTTASATESETSEKPTHVRRKRKRNKTATPTAAANPTQSRGMDALAQIDTGCQVGNVINRRVLEGLRGEHLLRDTNDPMWICSGLNNECIESKSVLDIVVSFKKDSSKYIFSLPVRIAEDSQIDLILGIDTIKNLNLVKIIPEFFSHVAQPDPWKHIHVNSSDTSDAANVIMGDIPMVITTTMAVTPHHTPAHQQDLEPPVPRNEEGQNPSVTSRLRQINFVDRGTCTNKCGTIPCGCATLSAAAAVDQVIVGSILQVMEEPTLVSTSPRQDSSEPPLVRVLEPATPNSPIRSPPQTHGYVAALLRENESHPEAQPFGPEGIDYKLKDTFAPFQKPSPEEPAYLIDLITIVGTPPQIARIRQICVNHIGLFKNELGPEPAKIPPFDMKVKERL